MYIIYRKYNGGEIIVCTSDDETRVIKEHFTDNNRTLDDYDRIETETPVCICSTMIFD